MKRGINGEIINDRLNIMAGPNLDNRLWVTEFDVENKDIDFRTEDVKDFVRSVFAHPNTEALILWTWLREVQRPWQPTLFNRALFEGDLTIGDPVVESNWPLNPNKAGKAFLDMVKDEWNSTQVLSDNIPNTIKLFKGIYSGKYFFIVIFQLNII